MHGAISPRDYDARLLIRHGRHFLLTFARKYGLSVLLVAAAVLALISWIPIVAVLLVFWFAYQFSLTGIRRIYLPAMVAVTQVLSLVGLIRGLARVTMHPRHQIVNDR